MGNPTYIGIRSPSGVTARYLHWSDEPTRLIPTLRAIWVNLNRDSRRLTAALLTENWSYLDANQRPKAGHHVVPGVGRPSYGSSRPHPTQLSLTDGIDGYQEWLYVVDPDTDTITVYEATVHSRWLFHSAHHLDPVAETGQRDCPADQPGN